MCAAKKDKKSSSIVVHGVNYNLYPTPGSGIYRLRKRTKGLNVDESLRVVTEEAAKEEARRRLEKRY